MNILKGLLEVVGGVVAGLMLGLFLCCFPSRDQVSSVGSCCSSLGADLHSQLVCAGRRTWC